LFLFFTITLTRGVGCWFFTGITNAVSFAGGLDLSAWVQLKAKADRFVLLGFWVLVPFFHIYTHFLAGTSPLSFFQGEGLGVR
jgi:hypothetical protein